MGLTSPSYYVKGIEDEVSLQRLGTRCSSITADGQICSQTGGLKKRGPSFDDIPVHKRICDSLQAQLVHLLYRNSAQPKLAHSYECFLSSRL